MSECPNCGSAFLGANLIFGRFECGSTETNDPGVRRSRACDLIRSLREDLAEAQSSYAQSELDLLQVIIDRDEALSLRAELVKADAECAQLQRQRDDAFQIIELAKDLAAVERDAERDQIADHLELRASKLEDELAISETSSEVGLERMLAVIKSLRREAQAIRSNEHRSNT